MDKGRRNELKKLKYKRRLEIIGKLNSDTLSNPKGVHNGVPYNFTGFVNSGKPCSCFVCSGHSKNKHSDLKRQPIQDIEI